MDKLWTIVVLILFCSVAFAGPNNYIGIDGDGKVYELNYGANSGSLNIDEGSHYETYSTSGTDIIYLDMATQSELDAVELTPGETGATGALDHRLLRIRWFFRFRWWYWSSRTTR